MSVHLAAQLRIGLRNITHQTLPKNLGRYLSCTWRTVQENDFKLILMVKMETRHPVEGYFGTSFGRPVIIAELWHPAVTRPGNLLRNFCVFVGKRPITVKIVKILFQTFSLPHRSTLLCSNFVKCCRWVTGKIVCYLLNKKISPACQTVATPLITPNKTPNNVLRLLQIWSKLVHFRRSYSRTHEHRKIAP